MLSGRRYLLLWSLATLGLLLVVATFNGLVDPYGLFGAPDLEGFNRIKSRASQRSEMFKRHAQTRIHARAIILGNSRAEIGFDPDSAVWPAGARPVFNFGLPGSGIESSIALFAKTLESNTPTLLLVGVEFLDFRAADGAASPAFAAGDRDGFRWIRERASSLLTLDALIDSIATVTSQHAAYPTSLTPAGFNPMRDYEGIARREGYHAMFAQRDQDNARAYVSGPKTIRTSDGRLAREFRAIEQLLALATQHRIAVRLVMYPYHAHSLVLFHEVGLWNAFEEWKREMVATVEREKGANDVELWDFATFSEYAQEAVPKPSDVRQAMHWYWEAGHFKKALGDAVLARIFGAPGADPAFGTPLSTPVLDEHLRGIRNARDAYEAGHASDVDALKALIAKQGTQ